MQRVVFDTGDHTERERLAALACAREEGHPSMPELQAWPAKVLRLPLDTWEQQPVHHIRDKAEELVRRQGQGKRCGERHARGARQKFLERRRRVWAFQTRSFPGRVDDVVRPLRPWGPRPVHGHVGV